MKQNISISAVSMVKISRWKGIVLLFLFSLILFYLFVPPSLHSKFKKIKIEKGTSLREIASLLKDEGIIKNEFAFIIYTLILGWHNKLKAKEYYLSGSMSLSEVAYALYSGKSPLRKLNLPAGCTLEQLGDYLYNKGFIKNKEEFFSLVYNKNFIDKLGIEAICLEGYLFSDTYYILGKLSTKELIEKFVMRTKDTVFKKSNLEKAKKLGLSMHQILILASIIEKETDWVPEMPIIAGVFYNRLKQKKPLESDPTVIYALGDYFDGDLKRYHFKIESPYNTYIKCGLPPSPIANPSKAAIEAALNPADVPYMYFVSMNNGKHKFATSFEEHKENIRKYQLRK